MSKSSSGRIIASSSLCSKKPELVVCLGGVMLAVVATLAGFGLATVAELAAVLAGSGFELAAAKRPPFCEDFSSTGLSAASGFAAFSCVGFAFTGAAVSDCAVSAATTGFLS